MSMDITITQVAKPNAADWLTRKQAAGYLTSIGCPISDRTLMKLAMHGNVGDQQGKGPPYIKFRQRHVRYFRRDLDVWAMQQGRRIA
jgi:hypothetical protein